MRIDHLQPSPESVSFAKITIDKGCATKRTSVDFFAIISLKPRQDAGFTSKLMCSRAFGHCG